MTGGRVAFIPFLVSNTELRPVSARAMVSMGHLLDGCSASVLGGEEQTFEGESTCVVEVAVTVAPGAASRRRGASSFTPSFTPSQAVRLDLAVSDRWYGFVTGPAVTVTGYRPATRRRPRLLVTLLISCLVAIGSCLSIVGTPADPPAVPQEPVVHSSVAPSTGGQPVVEHGRFVSP